MVVHFPTELASPLLFRILLSLSSQFIGASLNAWPVVAPMDAKPPGGAPFWAMVSEYMAGGTLKAYLEKRRSLTLAESVKHALDVARGME